MRENHYAILLYQFEISQVSNHKISITLLKILICIVQSRYSCTAKI